MVSHCYWLYIDGVNTLITMATGFGSSLGFTLQDLMVTLIIVQIVGVPASLFFGWAGTALRSKKNNLNRDHHLSWCYYLCRPSFPRAGSHFRHGNK